MYGDEIKEGLFIYLFILEMPIMVTQPPTHFRFFIYIFSYNPELTDFCDVCRLL
jgi:hypothetical protein